MTLSISTKEISNIIKSICEEIETECDISLSEETKDRIIKNKIKLLEMITNRYLQYTEQLLEEKYRKEIENRKQTLKDEVLNEIFDQNPSPELKQLIYFKNDLLNSLEREIERFQNTVQSDINAFDKNAWQFVEYCQINEFKINKQKEETK